MFPPHRASRGGAFYLLLAAAALITWAAGAQVASDAPGEGSPGSGRALLLTVQDAIGPATGDYIVRGIAQAEDEGAALVVIELDTPGGLDTSMRAIIQSILRSSVPVAVFVWPQGARAASAGTYILYASHIAAMAPATNLGAATPVAIGGVPSPPGGAPEEDPDGEGDDARPAPQPGTASERKAVNDAVAYIRSLAERRGRNADWAERAVREAESLSATQALELGVIDFVATHLDDLLRQIDGLEITMPAGEVTLATAGLVIERVEPDWRTRFLAVISNPTIAYFLLLIGIYGLILEGYNPGAILPGVVGAISLLLALFAFQILPVNYAGLALMVLGVILIVAEFFVPSFGALGIGGVAAFVFGSIILMDADVPGFGISIGLISSVATAAALLLLGVVWLAMRSRHRPVVSGSEHMAGAVVQALEDFEREGPVRVYGERWRARSRVPVQKGQHLRVTEVEGLLLYVEPLAHPEIPGHPPLQP
jgi:membrane-bound serine protease (ClpP class)